MSGYTRNQVRGIVGDVTSNSSVAAVMKFKAGNTLNYDASAIRCDYSNSSCYVAKAVPVINYIDSQSGYTTGGQLITVEGWGFNSANISATIDGQPCLVQNYQQDSFQCLTSADPTPSTGSFFKGQQGMRRKIFNTSTALNYQNIQTTTPQAEIIAPDL